MGGKHDFEARWDGPGGDAEGVHTREGQVVWWYRPAGEGGHLGEAARSQSFEDFLAGGPCVGRRRASSRRCAATSRRERLPPPGPGTDRLLRPVARSPVELTFE